MHETSLLSKYVYSIDKKSPVFPLQVSKNDDKQCWFWNNLALGLKFPDSASIAQLEIIDYLDK